MSYNDGFTDRYTASNIRPEPIPHHENPPIYKQACSLDSGNPELRKQPTVKFWIHQPTIRYPETACFISLTSGRNSAFSRITRNSIEQLAAWLAEVLRDSDEIFNASVDAESEFSDSIVQTSRVQDRITAGLQELRDRPRGAGKKSKSEGNNTGKSET